MCKNTLILLEIILKHAFNINIYILCHYSDAVQSVYFSFCVKNLKIRHENSPEHVYFGNITIFVQQASQKYFYYQNQWPCCEHF